MKKSVLALVLMLTFGSMINAEAAHTATTENDGVLSITNNYIKNLKKLERKTLRDMKAADEMTRGLQKLNVNRGGAQNDGFVAEYREAFEATKNGKHTFVVNDNGPADLIQKGRKGQFKQIQLKTGYKNGHIDFKKYPNSEVWLNKDNPALKRHIEEGAKFGNKVVEGNCTKIGNKIVSNSMKGEAFLTNSKTAKVVPALNGSLEKGKIIANTCYNASAETIETGSKLAQEGAKALTKTANSGISTVTKNTSNIVRNAGSGSAIISTGTSIGNAAVNGAVGGGLFSVGYNLAEVAKGNKNIEEAAVDVVKDIAVAGATTAAIEGTAALVTAAASTAVGTAVGSAVASTAVGSAVMGGAAAMSGAVALAGTALAATPVGLLVGGMMAFGALCSFF